MNKKILRMIVDKIEKKNPAYAAELDGLIAIAETDADYIEILIKIALFQTEELK